MKDSVECRISPYFVVFSGTCYTADFLQPQKINSSDKPPARASCHMRQGSEKQPRDHCN
jgi:hypothetical protein